MTPAEIKAARHALRLSAEGMAQLGSQFGRPLAQSGRTVRRWEAGEQDAPGAVIALLAVLLRSREARLIMGLPADLAEAA
jgi:DNA-binding transcriptional regulator YiaG